MNVSCELLWCRDARRFCGVSILSGSRRPSRQTSPCIRLVPGWYKRKMARTPLDHAPAPDAGGRRREILLKASRKCRLKNFFKRKVQWEAWRLRFKNLLKRKKQRDHIRVISSHLFNLPSTMAGPICILKQWSAAFSLLIISSKMISNP